ncbi:branched-chain amino acid ABC transporter ATP-binding protein [Burkholderia pseudomallei]|nr:branched-chain amino acid ABC transporter ATP-binding protein [Burkholderia pseudomallei]
MGPGAPPALRERAAECAPQARTNKKPRRSGAFYCAAKSRAALTAA